MDVATEYAIQQALDQLMAGRTSFVIAQRISTVRNADQILVLDRGRIVAQRHARGAAGVVRDLRGDLQLAARRRFYARRGRAATAACMHEAEAPVAP